MSGLKFSFVKSNGSKSIEFILIIIALIVLQVLLLLGAVPILLIRQIVARLGLILHPEFGKILSQRSTNLCLEEFHAHTENVILVDNILEGNFPLEAFRKLFTERVLNRKLPNGKLQYPELRQFVVKWMDFKFWRNEENFDVNEHIRLYNESRQSGSDGAVTEKEFREMRSTLMNSVFRAKRSPWEVVIVHNYESEDPVIRQRTDKPLSVVILKTHHALGDGYSLKKLVTLGIYGHHEMEKSPTSSKPSNDQGHCKCWRSGVKSLCNWVTFPLRCLHEFAILSVQLMKKGAWHVTEERQAPAVHAFTKIVSVSRVKRIKDKLKVSFSSISFHVCNEAMQKMMAKKGTKRCEDLIAIIPLPLPNHPDKLRNHMTYAALSLPTSPELTPLQRLEIIDRNYEGLKSSTIPFSVGWLSWIIGGMFTSLGRLLARGLVPPVVISSFPGSQPGIEWNLEGHETLSTYYNVGLVNLSGVAFSILTKIDDLRFIVTANRNILNEEDIMEFADILEREVNLLEDENIPQKCQKH